MVGTGRDTAATVRFIHTSDVHLGSSFERVDAHHGRVGVALREAVPTAFARVVDACLEHEVDFLVVAGDLFDDAGADLSSRSALEREVRRLDEAGIPAYVAGGNHDPGTSRLRRGVQGLHYFSPSEVERIEHPRDGEVVAVLYGRTHERERETRNLAAAFHREAADQNAVAVLHANVGGRTDFEPYAPCTTEDLRAAGMDYWALGHIHGRTEVLQDDRAWYPGCPQGLSPRDVGPHGCLLVEIADGRAATTFVETDAVRWASAHVDVSNAADPDGVRDALSDACEAVRQEADRPAVLRAELTGRAPVRHDLVRAGALEELLDVVRGEQMARDPWVWVDRLADRTSSTIDLDELAASESFVGDVVGIARDWLDDPERSRELVAEEVEKAAKRFRLADLEPDASAAVTDALDIVLDRLLSEEGTS